MPGRTTPHPRLLALSCALALAMTALGTTVAAAAALAKDRGATSTVMTISEADPVPTRGGPGPTSTRKQMLQIARGDEGFQRAMQYRPGSPLTASWRPGFGNWSVHLREQGGTRDLARMVIDDETHHIESRYYLPFGEFPPRLTERIVLGIVRRNAEAMRAIGEHGGYGKLTRNASYHDARLWEVTFSSKGKVKVQVDVEDNTGQVEGVWTGHQIAWKMARGNRHAFGGDINDWYVWLPLFVVFALVMIPPGWWISWFALDVLALLAFGISHEYFNRGMINWSVPLAMPPLLYLFARMSYMFVRGVAPLAPRADRRRMRRLRERVPARLAALARRLAPWPATWLLVVLAVFGAGLRYGVNYSGSNVIDVGYAGVAGANAILDHTTPYGNMPDDNPHGDTYGPLNYLVYVPAAKIWPSEGDNDWGGPMPAAHAVSIASDLLCLLALAWVGWRWISRRAAALLAAGWMTYPYAAFAVENNTNDLLVTALLLLAFAALPRAMLRGALVAVAGGIKFVPVVALAPIAHAGVRRRSWQVVFVTLGAVAVAAGCVAFITAYPNGWKRFVEATWGFQYDRRSPFSVWGLYGWRRAQEVLQVALLGVIALAAFLPTRRDFRQVAAGMAAAVIGVEIVLQHWFYLYVPWFAALVLVVLVARRESLAAPVTAPAGHSRIDPAASTTVERGLHA